MLLQTNRSVLLSVGGGGTLASPRLDYSPLGGLATQVPYSCNPDGESLVQL